MLELIRERCIERDIPINFPPFLQPVHGSLGFSESGFLAFNQLDGPFVPGELQERGRDVVKDFLAVGTGGRKGWVIRSIRRMQRFSAGPHCPSALGVVCMGFQGLEFSS